jgi:hypothetical protein
MRHSRGMGAVNPSKLGKKKNNSLDKLAKQPSKAERIGNPNKFFSQPDKIKQKVKPFRKTT